MLLCEEIEDFSSRQGHMIKVGVDDSMRITIQEAVRHRTDGLDKNDEIVQKRIQSLWSILEFAD